MSSEAWQAGAEVLGAVLALIGFVSAVIYAVLRTRFVTRGEHKETMDRLDVIETNVENMRKQQGELMTKADAREIFARLSAVEQGQAKMGGQLEGINTQLGGANNMLQMLVKHELREAQ